MLSQETIFSAGEGDAWFERNRAVLGVGDPWQQDYPLRMMDMYGIQPSRVLEIGASNGWRLNAIRQRFSDCSCWGVEPSVSAVEDGQRRYPDVRLIQGVAAGIDPDIYPVFDLILVPFVLHWVGRPHLMRTLANIDACLGGDGYLVITDFAPDAPTAVPYHHRKGVYTYKADYPAMFRATGLYREVAHRIFDHDSHAETADIPSERRAICGLLRKEM